MTVADPPQHDYKRHGTRTVLKRKAGRWTLWVEDRAMWHLNRTCTLGLEIDIRPQSIDSPTVTVSAGRYAVVLVRTR